MRSLLCRVRRDEHKKATEFIGIRKVLPGYVSLCVLLLASSLSSPHGRRVGIVEDLVLAQIIFREAHMRVGGLR